MTKVKTILENILDTILPRSAIEKRCLLLSHDEIERMILVKVRPLPQDYITALFDYRNKLIKTMIWMLKYRRNNDIAVKFAAALEHYLVETLSDKILFENFTDPILIPIPLSAPRKRARGFNQVELVAFSLVASNKSLCTLDDSSLVRTKNTSSQTKTMDKEKRRENLRSAFHVRNSEAITDRNIILLDDVITTGSTVDEARHTLLAAGAKQVWCVALAH